MIANRHGSVLDRWTTGDACVAGTAGTPGRWGEFRLRSVSDSSDWGITGAIPMAYGDVETYFAAGMWHNRREAMDGSAPISSCETKKEAVQRGRLLCAGIVQHGSYAPGEHTVRHIVRNEDGTIEGWDTFPHAARNQPRACPQPEWD